MNKGLTHLYVEQLEKGDVYHPLEFYNFLFDTIYHTSIAEKIASRVENGAFHLSPEKICSLFSQRMTKTFGSFSSLVLEKWKVSSSEDIGNAVFLMAEYKCLTLSGGESIDDFKRAGLDT